MWTERSTLLCMRSYHEEVIIEIINKYRPNNIHSSVAYRQMLIEVNNEWLCTVENSIV